MNYYYITGASRGLGRIVTERLLGYADTKVIGISRGDGPSHPNYRQIKLDLSDPDAVGAFKFDDLPDAKRIVLVNNAALHHPNQMGRFDADNVIDTFAINAIAPVLLMNTFVSFYSNSSAELLVCNITSSGATKVVRGATLYCATKAALEMATRVAAIEAESAGKTNIQFLMADPGGIDTDLWIHVLGLTPAEMPDIEMFKQRKKEGLLTPPEFVADRLVPVLADPSLAPDMLFRVQEMSLPGAN